MRPSVAFYHLMTKRQVSSTGCWEWPGPYHSTGYGQLGGNKTHRWSARIFLGAKLSPKIFICHRCDNKKCFNPAHLFIGDLAANARDMAEKGRAAMGHRHGMVRLTEEQVLQLIDLWNEGATYKDCAEAFGVATTTAQHIINRRNWAWLTEGRYIRKGFLRGYVRR